VGFCGGFPKTISRPILMTGAIFPSCQAQTKPPARITHNKKLRNFPETFTIRTFELFFTTQHGANVQSLLLASKRYLSSTSSCPVATGGSPAPSGVSMVN